jgi:hypothetical protein
MIKKTKTTDLDLMGCSLRLRPGRRSSGISEPQLQISKDGDRYEIYTGFVKDRTTLRKDASRSLLASGGLAIEPYLKKEILDELACYLFAAERLCHLGAWSFYCRLTPSGRKDLGIATTHQLGS